MGRMLVNLHWYIEGLEELLHWYQFVAEVDVQNALRSAGKGWII